MAETTNTYAHLDSLHQIRPPYPAALSADWWALRKRMEELIAKEQRRAGVRWTDAQLEKSRLATLVSLGDEDAAIEYQRGDFTRVQWLDAWPGRSAQALRNPGQLLKGMPR